MNLDEEHLSKPQQKQLKEVIVANSEIFTLELGTMDKVTHSVNISDHTLIRRELSLHCKVR